MGTPLDVSVRMISGAYDTASGSPGPLERKIPSGSSSAGIAPCIALSSRDARGQIESHHRRTGIERGLALCVGLLTTTDHSAHDTDRPQMSRETAGVNLLEDRHLRPGKPRSQTTAGSPVRVCLRQLANDDAGHLRSSRLGILGVDPIVPDLRSGHHHDLPAIRRVGENFLVARHVSGEHDLRYRGERSCPGSTGYSATKKGSVLKEEEPWLGHSGLGGQLTSSVESFEVSWFAFPSGPLLSVLVRAGPRARKSELAPHWSAAYPTPAREPISERRCGWTLSAE